MTWDTTHGEELLRTQVHVRYGGNSQAGIAPLAGSPDILIFSSREGARYGYNYDGWHSDGTYHYTGEGQSGDQRPIRGNAAILNHRYSGKTIRMFAEVRVAKPGGTVVRYEGAFAIDPDRPIYRADAPDGDGNMRSVIVFRLKPIDVVPPAGELAAAPRELEIVDVPLETKLATAFPVRPSSDPVVAERREAALVERYEAWRHKTGNVIIRKRIRLPGQSWHLFTDAYDVSRDELIEAKGAAARNDVRLALGQVLDYARYVAGHKSRAVLLPVHPGDDLVELLHSHGVGCIYETQPGSFERTEA